MKTSISILICCLGILIPFSGHSFCGFYVAKTDASLFNEASQVILARDGQRTIVTMSNDFKGDVDDFAMVVPVPVVLKEKDITVIDRYIFDKLDAYSGPRLVEYHDQNPCYQYRYEKSVLMNAVPTSIMDIAVDEVQEEDLGVTIEAQYTVGEYDILILSAEESSGLKIWLDRNGYQIPAQAEEVLEPYIKSDMKFFVAKVNLEEQSGTAYDYLRPLQISYESPKFMLPIRLGMANANESQDLVIYAFTKKGRVECTNYRTTKVPTDQEIPTFTKDRFDQFYVDLFEKAYKRNGRNSVFLEYAWDLSSSNFQKCDPCATSPPTYAELKDAGVWWANHNKDNRGWQAADYEGEVFITRLHVRYDRDRFPMDLQFQNTPNTEHFQGRYVMNHPVEGFIHCEGGRKYYLDVIDRREEEMDNLAYLTGWDLDEHDNYVAKYEKKLDRWKKEYKKEEKKNTIPFTSIPTPPARLPIALALILSGIVLMSWLALKQKRLSRA